MNKRVVFLISVLFFIMLVNSLVMNVPGVLVPTFKSVFEIRNTQIGVFFFLGSLFYMSGTYFAASIIDRIGRKRTLIFGTIVVVIGIISIILGKSVYLFYLYAILTSIGISIVSLVINTMITDINVKSKAVLINSVHFLYAVGAILTHKFSGYILHYNIDYRYVFIIYALLSVSTMVFIYFVNIPAHDRTDSVVKIKFTKPEKKIITILALGLGFYVSAELQTANWYLNYIVKTYSLDINKATSYTALFFLTFAFGRLFGGFVAERVGYLKSVVISALTGSILFLVGLVLKENGLIVIALSGIFFSIVFPTVVLSISNYFKKSLNQATSVIVSMASAVNMLMGFMMGYLSDNAGVYSAMLLIPIFLLTSSLLILYIEKKGEKLLRSDIWKRKYY